MISQGILSIEIINNFVFEITSLELELINTDNQVVVGQFLFNSISAGTSQVQSVNLADQSLYSDLEISIVEFSSDGSGPNPFDENSWLSFSNSDNMIFSISGISFQATEGSVKFPSQEGPSDSIIVDLQVDDDVEISFINLSSGIMVYNYESSVNTSLQLMIEIPSLKNEIGMVFSEIVEINNTQSSGPQMFSFSIDNYSFDLSESVNQIQVNYSSQIIGSDTFESFSENDEININMSIEDVEFSYIEGFFGQIEQEIEQDEMDFDLSILEEIASNLYFETPNLRFTVDNAIGFLF